MAEPPTIPILSEPPDFGELAPEGDAEDELAELPHASPDKQCSACEEASILVSLENLLTFPWIRSRVEQGQLVLHGWYFDIDSGELVAYDPVQGSFEPLA